MSSRFMMFQTAQRAAADLRPHVLGAAATAAAVAGLLGVFHATVVSLVQVWTSSVIYGHGILIPLIAGYLAYQRLPLVRSAPVRPALGFGGAGLAAAGGIWLAGSLTETQLLQHVGLIGMLQSTVLLILGVRAALALAFPLVYLVLAIPFGESLLPTLQDLTARHTTQLLRATGVPVFVSDWKMVTPDGAFLVAEVCAGLQYILACLAIGGLIAGIWYRTPWKRVVVLALAVAVPIGANVLRAYGIVMLADLVSFEAASGVAHVVYGFIFLSAVSLVFIAIAAAFRESGVPAGVHAGTPPGAGPRRPGATLALAAAFAIALGLGVKGTAAGLAAPVALDAPAAAPSAPAAGGPWARTASGDAWLPAFKGRPVATDAWAYTDGRAPVSLAVARYANSGEGADMIGGRLFFRPAGDSRVTHRGRVAAARVPGLPRPAYLRLEQAGTGERLVWYWYAVGGRLTSEPITGKAYQLLARLGLGDSGARLIVLATPAGEGAADALARFAGALDMDALKASPAGGK